MAQEIKNLITSYVETDYLPLHIETKSLTGRSVIEGFGIKRSIPSFNDLTFLSAALSRLCIDVHREECDTATVLGARFAQQPLVLQTQIIELGIDIL